MEVDETYIGGKGHNKHAKDGLRAGRGTTGKIPVAGMKNWIYPTLVEYLGLTEPLLCLLRNEATFLGRAKTKGRKYCSFTAKLAALKKLPPDAFTELFTV